MKKYYEIPSLELSAFDANDVVTVSVGKEADDIGNNGNDGEELMQAWQWN